MVYHPKYVEQFPDKINCVTLHLVGHTLEKQDNITLREQCHNILYLKWKICALGISALSLGIYNNQNTRLLHLKLVQYETRTRNVYTSM
jgi:hypothetical protein